MCEQAMADAYALYTKLLVTDESNVFLLLPFELGVKILQSLEPECLFVAKM